MLSLYVGLTPNACNIKVVFPETVALESQVCHCFGVLAEAVLLTLLGSRLTLAGHCLAQSCQAVAHWLFSRQHLWSTRPVRETTYGEFFALKFEALGLRRAARSERVVKVPGTFSPARRLTSLTLPLSSPRLSWAFFRGPPRKPTLPYRSRSEPGRNNGTQE